MVEQKISLDFSKNGVQRTVHARQGENAARDILISLVSNGEPVDVSDYSMRVIYPDGTHNDLAKKNPVKVTIPQALCVEVGEKICEIQISYETEGATLYSPQFRVLVEGTILGASGSSEPIGDPTVYQPLIAELDPYPSTLGTNAKIPIYDSDEGETLLADPDVLLGDVLDALDDKVDKVSGKGLSTNDYTTEEKTKLAGIESGAEVNDITDVQDENGNSLVTSKIAVIPSGNPTELVADEYYDLNFTTTAILEKYEASIAMTYEAHPVILVEKYGSNGADIFYISKYSGQIVVYRARYQNQTTLSGQIVVGAFSDNNYTTSEKTKLAGIETGAQVNLVNDVQDTEGNSLVSEGIATIPDEVIELQTAGVLNYTISQIWAMKGKKAMYYNGNLVVRLNVTATDPQLYEIYYIDYNNYSPYDTMLCKVTYNSSGERQGLAERIGHWFTSAEKTKLNNVEDYAEVNDVTDVQDSDGNSLVQGKIATLPPIPVLPTLADVATTGDYEDLINTPTIPTAGTITSGETGYATGGDVYSVVGNVEAVLAELIGGNS